MIYLKCWVEKLLKIASKISEKLLKIASKISENLPVF